MMRKNWFDYVAKIKKKNNRGKKSMSHAEAMKEASKTWPKEKKRIERRLKRCQQAALKPPKQKNHLESENDQS